MLPLADYFGRTASVRVASLFHQVRQSRDHRGYRLAQTLLEKLPASLATGFFQRGAVAVAPATARPTA